MPCLHEQVAFLEQENLQLMLEIKELRKQAMHSRAELDVMRKQNSATTLTSAPLPKQSAAPEKENAVPRKEGGRTLKSTLVHGNAASATVASATASEKTIDASATGDDATGECKQS